MRESGFFIPPLESAFSVDNGIVFISNCDDDYYVFSTLDTNNNVKTIEIHKIEFEKKYKSASETKLDKFSNKLTIVLFIAIILLLLFAPRENFILTICRCVSLLCMLYIVIGFFMIICRKSKLFFKYHGAEHIVINAYNDLQKIPTKNDLKKYSRYSNLCGGNFVVKLFVDCMCLFMCSYLPLVYGLIFFLVTIILTYIGYIKGKFNFIQKLTTEPPTEKELEVALAGLKSWFEKETEF